MYKVFYDYLLTTEQEKEAYREDPEEFDRYNAGFVMMTEDDYSDTVKEACGHFLQGFFGLNNQALVEFMEFLAAALRYSILGEESEKITNAIKKNHHIPKP